MTQKAFISLNVMHATNQYVNYRLIITQFSIFSYTVHYRVTEFALVCTCERYKMKRIERLNECEMHQKCNLRENGKLIIYWKKQNMIKLISSEEQMKFAQH